MSAYIIAWIVTALAFLGLDAVWLKRMWPRLYQPILGDITRAPLNLSAALGFYVVYVSAIVFFAVTPALERGGLTKALLNGAIFGFAAYATYNLTNQATLKAWDWRVTRADMAWGTIVTALAAAAAYAAASSFA
ncbi:MAG: DUF2177 family protein [Hyphomonadaceae bacterium]